MKPEELEKIVARHEMQSLELKESFGIECIETACAFANAQGGFIVIGVDDRGNPSKRQLRVEGLRDYENKISTATEPSVAVDAEKVDFRGREVVVLKVVENPLKPVAYRGRCFIRKGSVNHQMTPAEIAECHLKSTGSSMDAVFVEGATKDDLDMEAVRRYMRKAVREGRRNYLDDEEPWSVLKKLEWVKSETEITRAAYLMFAKFPQRKFSQAVVHGGAFKADGAVIYDSHDSMGNVQDQVEDALNFVRKSIRCAIVVSDKAEHDRYWEYPVEAIREAIANAVCHRDYSIGNDIQIKVFEDRVVITNPGQLPFDMTLEDLDNPDHSSRPRNKLLAQAFYDMHIIEHYGSGVRRMRKECDKNGSPYPVWTSEKGEFCIRFPARTTESAAKLGIDLAKLGLDDSQDAPKESESTLKTEEKTIEKTTEKIIEKTTEKIMSIMKARPNVTTAELADAIGLSIATINWNIRKLKDANRIRRIGPDKGGHWEVMIDLG